MCKDFAWSFSISLMLNNEGKHCTKLKAQGISMDFISQIKGAHWRHGLKMYFGLSSKCISEDIRNTLYF